MNSNRSDAKTVSDVLDQVMRASYGRLLAFLSSRSGDIQTSEDCLAEAFRQATETWKASGIPENPEAWIFQVAKNRWIDAARKNQTSTQAAASVSLLHEDLESSRSAEDLNFGDDRLKLMFVCCHPAIDEAVRTPLMLQTVLGLDSSVIASAFLTSPASMMKKLVRAKRKIKEANVAFSVPELAEIAGRVQFVAEAIYAIYGKSWDSQGVADSEFRDLDSEAIYLSELLVTLLPREPEALGLYSFILHCESRKKARRSEDGSYVPLDRQDTRQWDLERIEKAEQLLRSAFELKNIGRFQIESAIQSAHSARVFQKIDNWSSIVGLYEALARLAPTVGVFVSRAGALAEASGVQSGLESLDEIPADLVSSYQPYWALRADLLRRSGSFGEAKSAYERAIGLSTDKSVRDFLSRAAASK